MPEYTYDEFEDEVDGMVHGKIANLTDKRKTLNRAVRFVVGDVDLRSTKRRSTVSPNLFNDIYDYSCPTDLKGTALIDISPQVSRTKDSDLRLTTEEEFDRLKTIDLMMVAFSDRDFTRKLRVSMDIDDDELVISELDSLTSGGGTWAAFGDGTNLTADLDNFVKGSGSINWDISAVGGTTAGIYNEGLDASDISDYLAAGSGFVWHYITSATNITNFILRLGSSASAYHAKTVTTVNEGTAFVAGWNLLRFDLQSLSDTSSPDDESITYVALYMTKAAGKVSETDYRFDWLVLKRGKIHNVLYYSKYGWQTTGGTWIENSTATTDVLNVDTEEFELMTIKAAEFASQELTDYDDVKYFAGQYSNPAGTGKRDQYVLKWPSEAKVMITTYYDI